jgi:hypothetical protein
MATIEETFERTMRSKAAIDAAQALKTYHELLEDGVDPTTAFLRAFCGVHILVPKFPRPDYSTVRELYTATKEAHAYVTQLKG